jgi:hypothetical protein
VRLVDGDQPRRIFLEQLAELFSGERLGRGEDEQSATVLETRERVAALAHADRTVEADRGNAVLNELLVLILEQREQRRDDDRRPIEEQRRKLIAERFAAARRQDE